MKILGIETSCDETAAAIVENGTKIISNVVSSSSTLHTKTGGIIPEIASREQLKYMIPTLNETIQQCNNFTIKDVDAIAVTVGPGLIGSLLIGIETAKTISLITKKPIIPVNHIFAHVYANWLDADIIPEFPAISLIVSGGHTELFLIKSHTNWKWIGGTLDDAAGEAFDKTARLLGLGYPGGPEIAKMASHVSRLNRDHSFKIKLPRPMINSDDFNFSFSGLKTAVIREINKLGKLDLRTKSAFSYEIQEAVTDVLVEKTLSAAKKYNVKSILLGGGVASNTRLKEKFQYHIGLLDNWVIGLFVPSPSLCTDNAAVIASYAFYHNQPISWDKIQANPNLSVEVTDF